MIIKFLNILVFLQSNFLPKYDSDRNYKKVDNYNHKYN